MMKRYVFLFLWGVIAGCAPEVHPPPQANPQIAGTESSRLREIFEHYFEEFLPLFPTFATSIGDHRYDDQLAIPISGPHRAKQQMLYGKYLGQLAQIDRNRLDRTDLLNLKAFERMLRNRLIELKFPQDLLPLRQLASLPVDFPLLGSGRGTHPFKTAVDYDNFLRRIDGFPAWIDTAIANMRTGIERGVVQPRVVIERTLPQLDAMVVADPKQSIFYQPILHTPAGLSGPDKIRLMHAYAQAIEHQILPAYQKLRTFVQEEYLPKTRSTVGMSSLPDGNRWYEFLVRNQTTTNLTTEEIFQLGMDEIQRINKEMDRMRVKTGFLGNMAEFGRWLSKDAKPVYTNRADLIKGYEEIRDKVANRLPGLFGRLPRAPFEIRTIEEFRERSSPSQYWPASPDGSRPGIFYINAAGIGVNSPRRVSESLFLHEAVPGHHFQISLQIEREDLPRFRRYGGYNAFVEGWALYAESLGPDLGLYTEPYRYFGRLSSELFRAARLVVDVGIHRKGWTREQALKFLRETTMIGEFGGTLEIDRYIAWPAQALAYKIGQLKISAIRAKAEKALGPRFDIRVFHDELLKDGAMPLDLLEHKMNTWIEKHMP